MIIIIMIFTVFLNWFTAVLWTCPESLIIKMHFVFYRFGAGEVWSGPMIMICMS